VWLDGRLTPKGGPMTLRFGRFGREASQTVIDPRVCDCCGTSADGGLVAYRDRADGEIRDIKIARRTPTGWQTTTVHDDGWKMPGCPVNGPVVRRSGDQVAVAWFTGAGSARVRVGFSADGGRTFGPPVEVDAQAPLGRVGLALDGDEAIVSWLAVVGAPEGRARILVRRVHPDGRVGSPLPVAETATTRGAGMPQMVRRGRELVLVWTRCEAKNCGGLELAQIPLDRVPPATGRPRVGSRAPDRRPTDYRANDLSGQSKALPPGLVVVNLWASWCRPCRAELKTLAELSAARPKLALVAIAVDETTKDVEPLAKDLPFTVLHDPRAQQLFGASAIPATRVYGADGRLLWTHDGLLDLETLLRALPRSP
jgi:thiol-disulfide isomerase/thioredoxin